MDPYSSGEELHVKARKPYTITKQRERWTEEEHHRFLDALKLYGRAWQRIEEHIGTKTAVQIRSHAQKFFTKLEKEALIKGVPISQALDIEIPPPRPKRKPNNPYPRKTSITVPISQVGTKDGKLSAPFSSVRDRNELDLEKEPITEKPGGNEKLDNVQEKQHKKNCSQGFALFKEGACAASVSSGKSVQTLADSCPLNESIEKLAQDEDKDQSSQPDHLGEFSRNDMQAAYNYPRHVPVHILDGAQTTPDMFNHESRSQQTSGVQGLSNLYNTNPASSATSQHHRSNAARSSIHQSFPCFHPAFTPIRDPDDYRSFLQLSSTFSSLIVSSLLQNPAAHAAASFAASFWPYANMEAPSDSPAPSMAAIAATTVAAATAWWAAHGLLPFHSSFTCIPKSATSMQVDTCEPRLDMNDNAKEPGSECCEEQHSASKLPTVSSSDSEESEGRKLKAATDAEQGGAAVTEIHEPNAEKGGKQVDRSSCGSNTTSSSEVETDALGKDENGKVEEPQEPTISLLAGEAGNRRARNCISLNDSWKEVSEEGRLAFQALFSREILPQSFSPSNKGKINLEKVKQIPDEKGPSGSLLDLNDLASNICSSHQVVEDNVFSTCHKEDDKKCLPTMELIGQVRLKARRNGFKPYKRCSLEAKEGRGPSCQDEEKSCKRLRLEGEGST